MHYFPKTLNSSGVLDASNSSGSESGDSRSTSHSTGSSVSQTNSYDVSVSVGAIGRAILPQVSASMGRSTTTASNQESSEGRSSSAGASAEVGDSYSMSIKDWGCYAQVDSANQTSSWLWGQEYPWNIIQLNGGFVSSPQQTGNTISGTTVNLPTSVQRLLLNDGELLPPSELSLFGISLVAKAVWYLPAADDASEEYIGFAHSVSAFLASHSPGGTGNPPVAASLSGEFTDTVYSSAIRPRIVALDAITAAGRGNGAAVGFTPGQFIYEPDSSGVFRTKSSANNLYVTGTGFQMESPPNAANNPTSPDTVMTTQGLSPSNTASMTVYFKVLSKELDLTLYLKHWKAQTQGCVLSISVNGGPSIMRHVDSLELGSGSDNVTAIELCHRDFASAEYFDHLQLGLNVIIISITPSSDSSGAPQAGPSCAIRALAIA